MGLGQLGAQPWLLYLGIAAIAVPTMLLVMRSSWSREEAAHGPIVLATGLWLIWRLRPEIAALARPGSPVITAVLLVPCLILYALARITNTIEVEGFAMYGVLLSLLYGAAGMPVMRLLWFPLVYLAFIFPPPETIVWAITQPLKIMLSEVVVRLLYWLGYPIAGSGVTIQIAQFELLVAAACAGLNSLISLTAIGLFYVYIRHNLNWRYAAFLGLAIFPAALFANFVRVIVLVLVTYYFGEAAAQGFLHGFAGITMFVVALLAIFLVDKLASPLRRRLQGETVA
jgi:exosortase